MYGLYIYISDEKVVFKGNLIPTIGLRRYGLDTLTPFTYDCYR